MENELAAKLRQIRPFDPPSGAGMIARARAGTVPVAVQRKNNPDMKLTPEASGTFAIAPTPFFDDGRIDFDSIDRLTDFYREVGCNGITVLGILDAGSRKLLRLEVLPTKCALVVLGHLLIAIGIHGLPRVIRTDNEVIFTSKLWLATLKALGVVHRRGPPCQPWRNGRIERAFGTLKTALRGLRFATALGLQATLNRFAQWYNEARPHQSLGGLTPAEVWQGQTMTDVRRSHDDPTHRARIVRGLLAFHRLRCPRG